MPRSTFGSGNVSWDTRAERIAAEAVRRVQLAQATAAADGTAGVAVITGTAGPAYTADEQTLINALVAQVNAQAAQITAMQAALTANGITT